jgi:hypothetical protein
MATSRKSCTNITGQDQGQGKHEFLLLFVLYFKHSELYRIKIITVYFGLPTGLVLLQ